MATTIKVDSISAGTLKEIPQSIMSIYLSARDAWENVNSSIITAPYTCTLGLDPDVLIGEYTTISVLEFSADTAGTDGQGFRNQGFDSVKVTSLTGTVKILRGSKRPGREYTCAQAYANSDAVSASVNDIVNPWDIICCDKYGKFKLEFAFSNYIQKYWRGALWIGIWFD